jgi:hypothetical protein
MVRLAVALTIGLLALGLGLAQASNVIAGPPPCVDPTPGAGGEPDFGGLGTPNHYITRQEDVCPGQTDEWEFSTLDTPSANEYIGVKVTGDAADLSITVQPQYGGEQPLASGAEYRGGGFDQAFTYYLRVTGIGAGLASYRLQICRAIFDPCAFSEVPSPGPGDANCDGSISALDAAVILQYTAHLIPIPPCLNGAEENGDGVVNSLDAVLVLQFVAGLIYELPLA